MERKAICLLTRILRNHGISTCTAETFRLAKHDQREAIVPMWNLLKNMIQTISSNQPHKERLFSQLIEPCSDVVADQHHDYPPLSQVIPLVQKEFYSLGYTSWDFYQLSQDDTSSGSRDLLLAFAWFLCRVDYFGLLLKRMSFLEQMTPTLKGKNAFMNNGVAEKIPPTWNVIDCVKYMTLIHGKLMLTCRHLHALQREDNRLAHKLHTSTQGIALHPGLNHLTQAEAQILRSESEEKLTSLLEDLNSKIEDILKWKESEDSFWKWMESVIMLKVSNPGKVLCDSQNTFEKGHLAMLELGLSTNDRLNLQEAKKKLNETLVHYGPYINRLDRLWHQKPPTFSSKVHSKIITGFHAKIKDIEAESNLSQKRLSLLNQTATQHQHNYCFDDPKLQGKNIASVQNSHRKLMKKKKSEEDIAFVNEKKVKSQRKFEKELDSVSTEFQHLICIPVSN